MTLPLFVAPAAAAAAITQACARTIHAWRVSIVLYKSPIFRRIYMAPSCSFAALATAYLPNIPHTTFRVLWRAAVTACRALRAGFCVIYAASRQACRCAAVWRLLFSSQLMPFLLQLLHGSSYPSLPLAATVPDVYPFHCAFYHLLPHTTPFSSLLPPRLLRLFPRYRPLYAACTGRRENLLNLPVLLSAALDRLLAGCLYRWDLCLNLIAALLKTLALPLPCALCLAASSLCTRFILPGALLLSRISAPGHTIRRHHGWRTSCLCCRGSYRHIGRFGRCSLPLGYSRAYQIISVNIVDLCMVLLRKRIALTVLQL